MAKLDQSIGSENSPSVLVVGTENSEVLVLDKNCKNVQVSVALKSVPVQVVSTGSLAGDYKIFTACRNGCTYLVKNGKLSNSFNIHIESKPTGLLKLDKTIVISAMNMTLYSFFNKGRINFTKIMPAEITDICKM